MSENKIQKAKGKIVSKNSKFRFILLSCTFSFFLLPFTFNCYAANPAKKSVKEANKLYQKGKLDEALQKYNEASVAMPDSDIVNFNMGAASYKKEDYQKAMDAFMKALISDDKKTEADALYNVGNCKYKLGKLKENTDLSATVGLLRESLDYYKRAVEIDQKNEDARFNHEFVERELKVLLDKLKQQQSEKEKQQGRQEQEQKDDQEQQGAQSAQEQEQQEGQQEQKEGSGQAKEEQKGEEEGQRGRQEQKEQQEEQEQKEGGAAQEQTRQEEGQPAGEDLQEAGENGELSKEGARALLERYGREEGEPDYMDKQTPRDYDRQILKDW